MLHVTLSYQKGKVFQLTSVWTYKEGQSMSWSKWMLVRNGEIQPQKRGNDQQICTSLEDCFVEIKGPCEVEKKVKKTWSIKDWDRSQVWICQKKFSQNMYLSKMIL